jgi:hypothetical protein
VLFELLVEACETTGVRFTLFVDVKLGSGGGSGGGGTMLVELAVRPCCTAGGLVLLQSSRRSTSGSLLAIAASADEGPKRLLNVGLSVRKNGSLVAACDGTDVLSFSLAVRSDAAAAAVAIATMASASAITVE